MNPKDKRTGRGKCFNLQISGEISHRKSSNTKITQGEHGGNNMSRPSHQYKSFREHVKFKMKKN
jgi:hypothetical protein